MGKLTDMFFWDSNDTFTAAQSAEIFRKLFRFEKRIKSRFEESVKKWGYCKVAEEVEKILKEEI